MPPVTSSTLTQQISKTLCYYFNSTNKIQLIRLWDGRKYSLDKIVSLGARSLALKGGASHPVVDDLRVRAALHVRELIQR